MRSPKAKAPRAPSSSPGRALLGGWTLGLLTAVGCAPPGATPTVTAEHRSLVQLEVTYSREPGSREPAGPKQTRLEAHAHFVRYRAADRTVDESVVAGLLGISGAGGAGSHALALDACTVDHGGEVLAAGALEVALLDAGPLTLRSGDAVLGVLEPQAYPDLLQFVTGVVYAAELGAPGAASAAVVSPATHLSIEAQGGEDVGPFVVEAAVPVAFPELRTTVFASELELRWSPLSTAPAPGVELELRWQGERPGLLRCRVTDDGRFVIPRALSPELDAALRQGALAQVSVARSERAAFEAPWAGPGQVLVTIRDVASLSDGQIP